jgi:large conductance mechanosensitive channel
MRNIVKEFKEFAVRGNVMDLAIGVIIGGAFGKIVTSLVNDIIMPAIGVLVGGVDFSNLSAIVTPETINEAGEVVSAVMINYGLFINTVIDFLIVAFAIFAVVKGMNKVKKKQEKQEEEKIKHPTQVELLAEIRDLLKK